MEAVKTTQDSEIQVEIDALRSRFPNTLDLYREACVVLFFRYGITPTANKLYQLVRKGSMSAPAEALSRFWADLREKSRVRVDHGDLPDEIRVAAGELVAALWNRALAQAEENLAAIRQEAAESVRTSLQRAASAEAAHAEVSRRLEDAGGRLAAGEETIRRLEQALAGETATRQVLEREITASRSALDDLRRSADEARLHFAAELDKVRESLVVAEARHLETQRQLSADLERERRSVAELKLALEQGRSAHEEAQIRYRKEAEVQAGQIAEVRQLMGRLEGEIKVLGETRSQLTADLADERSAVADLAHRLAAATREADRWQLKTIEAHREVEVLKAARLRKATRAAEPELDLGAGNPRRGPEEGGP